MTSARIAARTSRYLTHTCTLIEPGAQTGHDPEGGILTGPATGHPGVACWHYQPPARGEIVEPGRALVAHERRVLVPAGTVVAESWHVADVRAEPERDEEGEIVAPGALIVAGPLAITEILRYRGHLTLVCAQATTGDTAP